MTGDQRAGEWSDFIICKGLYIGSQEKSEAGNALLPIHPQGIFLHHLAHQSQFGGFLVESYPSQK